MHRPGVAIICVVSVLHSFHPYYTHKVVNIATFIRISTQKFTVLQEYPTRKFILDLHTKSAGTGPSSLIERIFLYTGFLSREATVGEIIIRTWDLENFVCESI